MKPRYIPHTGGPMPVDGDTAVEVIGRIGILNSKHTADHWDSGVSWWEHKGDRAFDIIAYRVIEQETNNE